MPRLKSSSPRFSAILRTSWTDCWPMRCALGKIHKSLRWLEAPHLAAFLVHCDKNRAPGCGPDAGRERGKLFGRAYVAFAARATSPSKESHCRFYHRIWPAERIAGGKAGAAKTKHQHAAGSSVPWAVCRQDCIAGDWPGPPGRAQAGKSMRITATGIIFDILFSMANPSSGAILPFSAAHLPGWPVCPCLCQG